MFQLILTIAAIALTSALLLASINYIPWWYKSASDTEEGVRKGLVLVEQAYDVATRTANGVPPSTEGGFSGAVLPVLKLLPVAPAGFEWRYGRAQGAPAPWTNLDYFCLEYTADDGMAGEGVWRGVQRVRGLYSAQQLVIADQCGATVSSASPSSYPQKLAVTLYVVYTPGISK